MLTKYAKPKTPGDTSLEMREKLANLQSLALFVVLDAGPEDSVSGKFYDECYGEISRRERKAIDSLALDAAQEA